MLTIKLIGIVLIVFASTLAGFLKSRSLLNRSKKLLLLLDGVNMLFEYVEQEGCELSEAVKNSFCKCDFLNLKENIDLSCESDLKKDDKLEIVSFFSLLGSGVKKLECDRIINFKAKVKSLHSAAEKDVLQKCRIYQTFGICIGLSIGILLI